LPFHIPRICPLVPCEPGFPLACALESLRIVEEAPLRWIVNMCQLVSGEPDAGATHELPAYVPQPVERIEKFTPRYPLGSSRPSIALLLPPPLVTSYLQTIKAVNGCDVLLP